MERIEEKGPRRATFSLPWPSFKWLVPALSTAVVVLLIGGGLMFEELRELQRREDALSDRVERQEHLMREGGFTAAASVGIGDRLVLSSSNWTRVLARQEETSIAQLQSLLERLPPATQILDSEETAKLIARYNWWIEGTLDETAPGIDPRDGLQAEEMIRLIRALDPDPDTRIRTERLISLSQPTALRRSLLRELRGL
jgi:hypothetical protein